jgi:hypothetical protein
MVSGLGQPTISVWSPLRNSVITVEKITNVGRPSGCVIVVSVFYHLLVFFF